MKLSIITINRNHREGLAATIRSVAEQTFRDFEHIIIDGASTDGGAELAREYAAANPAFVKCVSEPDTGVYNAMNKGIPMACGEYAQFLNSGDILAAPDSLARVFAVPRSADILYGDFFRRDENGVLFEEKAYKQLTPGAFYWKGICHQSEFYRRELFGKFGAYDESYKIAADWEITIRFLFKGATSEHMGFSPVVYENGGISDDERASVREIDILWKRLFPPLVCDDYKNAKADMYRLTQLEHDRLIPRALWANLVATVKWQFRARFGKNKKHSR